MRKIIHIDMNCFYAAIEMRDNPALRDKPIAVGGAAESRGVLCTSNYIARQFGVRSAMSTAYALRLCPNLTILPVDMLKYRAVSKMIREIFFEYTSLVEPLSLDEAFLDVSECQAYNNQATRIAAELRQKITVKCGITASAGIAPNKFLAKIASDMNKPNGQYVIKPHKVSNFVYTLPVNKIFGVGKVTAAKLENNGITTCGQLQKKSEHELITLFGKFGASLYQLCRGIDDRKVEPSRVRKSVSVEKTFPNDLITMHACVEKLPDLLEQLKKRLSGNTHQIYKQFVKIKFSDFISTTVETTSITPLFNIFKELLITGYNRKKQPVRLLGIGVAFKKDDCQRQYELNI